MRVESHGEPESSRRRSGERGFALVLAILSLMLLTFLGLTMATTTSTELQIATNYRWSQQALYNAEAGLEAARVVLSRTADVTTQWSPSCRRAARSPATWLPGAAPPPVEPVVGRDFYRSDCDQRGGVGYGLVLTEGATRYENQSVFDGHSLNGAFTLWIRRGLVVDNAGQYSDDATRQDALIVVAEGVAPYTGAGDAFTRARQAVPGPRDPPHALAGRRRRPLSRGLRGPGGRVALRRELLRRLRAHHRGRDGQPRGRLRRQPSSGSLAATGTR